MQPNEDIRSRIHMARRGERRGGMRTAVLVMGVVLCAASLALGTAFGVLYWGSSTFRRMVAGHMLENPLTRWTPEKQFAGRPAINVLVLGVDRDIDRYHRILKTNGRSDAILIARVDFAGRSIRALTIPRDTAVHIPGRRGIHKINAAHAFGGPELTIETIREVFGVQADEFVTINFDGFCKVVDAIGGVDINVEKRLKYDDNWGGLHINLYPGYQHLNGYQAMGYVRMRHSDSDEMRSKRQHAFLEAVRTKIKHPGTFMRLPQALDQVSESLRRSQGLTEDQLFTLANFARSLPRESIQITTLPSIEGRSYVTVKVREAEQVIQSMFFSDGSASVSINTPDSDVVASMNGRYGGRSARRNRSTSGESAHESSEPPADDDSAAAPDAPSDAGAASETGTTGDGVTAGDPPPAETSGQGAG